MTPAEFMAMVNVPQSQEYGSPERIAFLSQKLLSAVLFGRTDVTKKAAILDMDLLTTGVGWPDLTEVEQVKQKLKDDGFNLQTLTRAECVARGLEIPSYDYFCGSFTVITW